MRRPRALRSGDRIAVVAPASPFDRATFERGVLELGRLGFEPVFDERVFEREEYVAGTAQLRAESLLAAWNDPTVAGIMAVRGGYGSMQVLPLLHAVPNGADRKPLIGCSDVTALLTLLTTGYGIVGFHGPMLVNLAAGEAGYDRQSLLGAITSSAPLGELRPPGIEVIRGGEARGTLLGGTLTQLVASLGTPFAFAPPAGYTLLLDDVGERPYRIDRMLTQLRQAGLLARAVAVVCAEFPGCDDSDGRTARDVIARCLRDFDGPVLFGFPTGHTAGPLWTLPLGVTVTVATSPVAGVLVEESGVT